MVIARESEKEDKRIHNRRFRRICRLLTRLSPNKQQIFLMNVKLNKMETKYILVSFPEIQDFMDHPRFNECIFCGFITARLIFIIQIMKIFKTLKQLLCKHSFDSIILEDVEWDRQNDNDDLEDIPSFIEVTYCQKCGKIINVENSLYTNLYCYPDIHKYDNFKKVTGLDPENFPLSKYI